MTQIITITAPDDALIKVDGIHQPLIKPRHFLDDWRLTLPIGLPQKPEQIDSPNGVHNDYFRHFRDRLEFCNIVSEADKHKAATTKTAKSLRSELSSFVKFDVTEKKTDPRVIRVTQLGRNKKDKVILHQLHGGDEPWIKIALECKGGDNYFLRAGLKEREGVTDRWVPLIDNIQLADALFQSTICHKGVNAAGKPETTIFVNGRELTVVFDRPAKGKLSINTGAYGDEARVTHYL